MRVLFATHQFFPDHGAGTEVLTLGLARELRARGHETAVFAAKRSAPFTSLRPGEAEDYTHEEIPVRRVGRPHESLSRPFRLNYDNPDMAARLEDHVREFRPDVVHFMHLQGLSATAISSVKKLGLPAVYTATDFWAVCPVVDLRRHDGALCTGPDPAHCPRCLADRRTGSRAARLVARLPGPLFRAADTASRLPLPARPLPLRLMRELSERPGFIAGRINALDRVLAPTRLTRDLLVANGVDSELVEVSRYGIDTADIGRGPRAPSSRLRLGYIGTLAPHKGCDLLVRAVKRLPQNLKVSLTVHGGGGGFEGYAADLEELAGGDPRVTFAGTFPPEEVGRVLSEMDVLMVPSRWYENTPLVVYSAFASGTPVVATDLGGLSEVVEHDKNGLLFGLESVEGLEAQLRRLAGEPGLVERLRAGIGPVKTLAESAEELEKLYNGLVRRGDEKG